MKKSLRELCTAIAICFCATGNLFATDNQINTDHTMDKNLNLIKEWDKVFPQSDKVSHSKVTFRNRYGHYACRRYVQTQACGWKIACYRY